MELRSPIVHLRTSRAQKHHMLPGMLAHVIPAPERLRWEAAFRSEASLGYTVSFKVAGLPNKTLLQNKTQTKTSGS